MNMKNSDHLGGRLSKHPRRMLRLQHVLAAGHVLEVVVTVLVRLHGLQHVVVRRQQTHANTLRGHRRSSVVGVSGEVEAGDLEHRLVLTAHNTSLFRKRNLVIRVVLKCRYSE